MVPFPPLHAWPRLTVFTDPRLALSAGPRLICFEGSRPQHDVALTWRLEPVVAEALAEGAVRRHDPVHGGAAGPAGGLPLHLPLEVIVGCVRHRSRSPGYRHTCLLLVPYTGILALLLKEWWLVGSGAQN